MAYMAAGLALVGMKPSPTSGGHITWTHKLVPLNETLRLSTTSVKSTLGSIEPLGMHRLELPGAVGHQSVMKARSFAAIASSDSVAVVSATRPASIGL